MLDAPEPTLFTKYTVTGSVNGWPVGDRINPSTAPSGTARIGTGGVAVGDGVGVLVGVFAGVRVGVLMLVGV